MRRLAARRLTVTAGVLSVYLFTAIAHIHSALAAPLVQEENLVYQGAFRLPEVPYGGGYGATYGFDYAISGIAYNSANDSLFINNHAYEQKTTEVSIPEPVADTGSLPRAELLQDFADITEGRRASIAAGGADYGSTVNIGGLLVSGSKLIGSVYAYYDAAHEARLSHFSSSLELSTMGDFDGMYQVSTLNPGFVGGYMAEIPPEWRSQLGGSALTGQCCIPIIGRSSFGPAAFVFDPNDLGSEDPVPATGLVYYDSAHPALGEWGNTTSQNLYYNMSTSVNGIVFPSGTDSILFFGTQGTGVPCYGEGGATEPEGAEHWCYDPANGSKGTHAYPYEYWVWAYDANDLKAAKNGEKNPWDIKPYAVWSLELPLATDTAGIQGAAYDPETQRLFISQTGADGNIPGAGPYDTAPVIQVFKINNASAPDTDLTLLVPEGPRLVRKRRKLQVIMSEPDGITGVTYELHIRIVRLTATGRHRKINRARQTSESEILIGRLRRNDRVRVQYRYTGWGQQSELSPRARKRIIRSYGILSRSLNKS